MRKHLTKTSHRSIRKLGYIYIPSEKAEQIRGNLYNVCLRYIEGKLIEFNEYQYKGRTYKFSTKI